MAEKKELKSEVRQVRLPEKLSNDVDLVLQQMNMSFSEAVRIFLMEMVKEGRMPFRPNPDEKTGRMVENAKMEDEFLKDALGISTTSAEERLLKAIFGETSGRDMSSEQLRDWAEMTGLPANLRIGTLEDLYDSGLFAIDPWSGSLEYRGHVDDSDKWTVMLMLQEQTGNIRANLEETFRKMLNNAMNAYLNADVKNNKSGKEVSHND